MSQPLTTTIGWSTKADATRAGKEAAENAVARLSSRAPSFALVFGSSWFDQAPLLDGVCSVLGELPLIGGSTAGEIIAEGPMSHSCVVVLVAAEAAARSVGLGEGIERNAREAGQQAAYAALQSFQGSPRRGFLVFGDGLTTDYAQVLRGVQEVLGTGSLIVGALAGDDLRFTRTHQYINRRVVSGSVVGMLLGGALNMGVGCEHGFTPMSKPRRITRARANVLYELDQQPAASVYAEYFGKDLMQRMHQQRMARQAIAYPFGVQTETGDRWVLRNVTTLQDDGSLVCSGELPEGAWVQLMIGSRELTLDAARSAAQQAVRSLNQVGCVLVFDSVVRRTLLGPQQAAAEVACIRQAIGPSIPLAGCYTYGEHAPLDTRARYDQNTLQTSSVLVVALGT